ncbi:TPA: hypothetical protein HA239_05065 [Candidatus Woesearchaeota archaeon]|nr:hypothetical protein QT06_C0001G0327 [archaeon GW2011_AR15]MBS3103645.1 hypothetical protein [Candidatus Woesearchaeota archaeon]HIH41754.1 hypothetical protein [Candidatus Woesearchaeota archaeon]
MKNNIVYELLKQGSRLLDDVLKDRKKFLVSILLVLLGVLTVIKFERIFFTAVLIGLGVVSLAYIRFFRYAHYVGIELCMMATVLISLAYGSAAGAVAGFATITGALVLSGYFKPSYIVSVIALPMVGLIVPFFSALNLWQLGVLMTVLYDLFVLPLYIMMGSKIESSAVFFITHVLFNYWVFTTIAPFFYTLII